jgi:hypothetical protein
MSPSTQELVEQLRKKLAREIAVAESEIATVKKIFTVKKKRQTMSRRKRRKK